MRVKLLKCFSINLSLVRESRRLLISSEEGAEEGEVDDGRERREVEEGGQVDEAEAVRDAANHLQTSDPLQTGKHTRNVKRETKS